MNVRYELIFKSWAYTRLNMLLSGKRIYIRLEYLGIVSIRYRVARIRAELLNHFPVPISSRIDHCLALSYSFAVNLLLNFLSCNSEAEPAVLYCGRPRKQAITTRTKGNKPSLLWVLSFANVSQALFLWHVLLQYYGVPYMRFSTPTHTNG